MLTAAQIRFRAGDHTYWDPQGRRVYSTTQIMSEMGLLPAYPDNGCKERGSAVHYCCLLLDQGRLAVTGPTGLEEFPGTAPELWGYLRGFLKYRRKRPVRVIASEELIYNPALVYTGQLDCRAIDLQMNEMVVDDFKSGEPANAVRLQLASYVLGLATQHPKWRRARRRAVQLTREGDYEFTTCEDEQDFDDWVTVVRYFHFTKRFRR